MEPEELITRAREIGLDGVAITEHDQQWKPDELADLAQSGSPLKVFSGVEISAREGHFLVYGLPDLNDVGEGIPVGELLKVAARHGAAVVAAHPFRWGQPFGEIIAKHGPAFDALELVSNNITRDTREKTCALLAEHPMGKTGSSDAHHAFDLGCYYTEFDVTIETLADLVAALKGRRGRPRHRPGAKLSSGPVEGD